MQRNFPLLSPTHDTFSGSVEVSWKLPTSPLSHNFALSEKNSFMMT